MCAYIPTPEYHIRKLSCTDRLSYAEIKSSPFASFKKISDKAHFLHECLRHNGCTANVEARVIPSISPCDIMTWHDPNEIQALNIELRCMVAHEAKDVFAPIAPLLDLNIKKNVVIIDWSFKMARAMCFSDELLVMLAARGVERVVLCDTYTLLSADATERCCARTVQIFSEMQFGYCIVDNDREKALEKLRRASNAGIQCLHVNLPEEAKMSIPLITDVQESIPGEDIRLSTTFDRSGVRFGTNRDL